MVQIVENWTELSGRIEGTKPSDVADKFVTVNVAVQETKPVSGFANLLQDLPGKTVAVEVQKATAEKWKVGDVISCRVRLGGNRKIFSAP